MTTILALNKPIDDAETQTTVTHHVLSLYQVDLVQKKTRATLAAYAKAGATRPVAYSSLETAGVPPAGDAVQWLYQQILATDSPANALFGATPVLQTSAPVDDAPGAGA